VVNLKVIGSWFLLQARAVVLLDLGYRTCLLQIAEYV